MKAQNFIGVFYTDSLDVDVLINFLSSYKVKYYISPLHDKDNKKPHYHLVLHYSSVREVSHIRNLLVNIGVVVSPKDNEFVAKSFRSSLRYLLHLDNSDKYSYFVVGMSPFELFECIETNDKFENIEKYFNDDLDNENKISLCINIIDTYQFKSFSQFVQFLCANHPSLLNIVSSKSYFFISYIKCL